MPDTTVYENRIQSVSDLTRSIKGLLETHFPFVSVAGEISNMRQPYSGHLYFTLKDSEAQLKAVPFKMQLRYLTEPPREGQEVVCRGRISVYEPRGDYQLIVDYLYPKGTGELQMAFEALKRKLDAEGLFDAAHKKILPVFPERVALITSPGGAAVHDFIKSARKRFSGTNIVVYPAKMQGDGAADDIVKAIELANRRMTEQTIILCRGGGSIEDLWAFNEEKVARAVYSSKIPVVSAVGHEIDFTIADFVADHRAPTPTAAAEACIPDKTQLTSDLVAIRQTMLGSISRKIDTSEFRLHLCRKLLERPGSMLIQYMLRFDYKQTAMHRAMLFSLYQKKNSLNTLTSRITRHEPALRLENLRQRYNRNVERFAGAAHHLIERKTSQLASYRQFLLAVSPMAVLERGYAIARAIPDRTVLTDSGQGEKGDAIELLLARGRLECDITKAE